MSDGTLIATLLALIAGVVVAAVTLIARADRKRAAELERAARRLGWTRGDDDAAPPSGAGELWLFRQGRSRRASSVFTGRVGRFGATLFDYRYTVGAGRNSRLVRQTVLALELPESALPAFELRPENLFHKIGTAFGMQDIDLDNRPEFSSAYLLRGTDEAAVRRLFEMGIARHFERHRGWSVDGAGRWLVVYRSGKRVRPDDLGDFVRDADQIASTIAAA